MANIKIGGVTYNNVDTLKIKNADTNEYTDWKGAIPGGYMATFKVSGDDYAITSIQKGGAVNKPGDPVVDGYVEGWSVDSSYSTLVKFPYTLSGDTTFYAKISQYRQVPVKYNSSGQFSTISNMDKSKTYTVFIKSHDDVSGFISFVNNTWTVSYPETMSQYDYRVYLSSQTETSVDFWYGASPHNGRSSVSGAVLEAATELSVSFFSGITSWSTINYNYWECLVEGTPITLADRTTKPVEDITYDDDLLVWNFYEGKLDSAKPCWIMKPQTATKYNLCKFSNGSEVGFVGPGENIGYHRIYNDETKMFTHTGVPETPIGTHTFAEDGSFPELVSQEVIQKGVRFYNIGTTKHINLFANGILTSARISNKYAIQDMKYVGDRLISEEDEQKYILRVLETKC